MSGKKQRNVKQEMKLGNYNLSLPSDRTRLKSMLVELVNQTQALTRKDLGSWRTAWQMALNPEQPRRQSLYDLYRDVDADLHITGCIGQRKGFVLKKGFKLVDKKGSENPQATELLEAAWFKDFMDYTLDSRYWGHSLIQLGDVVVIDGEMRYKEVTLVPRKHVIPEYGVIIREQGDDWQKGYDYRNSDMSAWIVETGRRDDLGLFLKAAPQMLPKKNMFSFWDQFGEMFGMPIRIGKTTTRDSNERNKLEQMLSQMGNAAWGLFPDGTDIEIKETTRGDAFNVYDKRIDRANSELSKGLLNQTMTIDNGSSLSQSQVHLEVFNNVIERDADYVKDIVNDELLPRMTRHGFPVKGLRFIWDESLDYTPEQQIAYEGMISDRFDVDPQYFIDKYNIPIITKKEKDPQKLNRFFD